MIYYRVCYFILNPNNNTWETVKEYPLSEAVVWTRVDYLLRSTPSLIWLEEVALRGVCEDCEHCYWEEEQNQSYCGMHGTFVPDDWSCSDFDNIK